MLAARHDDDDDDDDDNEQIEEATSHKIVAVRQLILISKTIQMRRTSKMEK